jgi:integrase/recombinase XerD
MSRSTRLYLPRSAWPELDRTLWHAAHESGADPFDDCGPAVHYSQRTRLQLEYAYGKFLYFLSARHTGLLARAPAERLNRQIIEQFVKWQPKSCGGITIGIYLYHLWLTFRFMCPDEDWSWLLLISKRIAVQARPKPEKHHLVTSETLYAIGIELMDDAINSNRTKNEALGDAVRYRAGLIIALLALIPLRRRTLAALRIGKHLVKSGDLWMLDIPAEDVKTKRALEYPLSGELSGRIDLYLDQFRPRFRGSEKHAFIWASNHGRPMHDGSILGEVRRRTCAALGFPVNLHRFRRAAATFWSSRDPVNIRGVKDLLGHASFSTTEKHYIMGQSRLAGRVLALAICKMVPDCRP